MSRRTCADEPTGNLDRQSSDEVLILLRELSRDEGTAFLISTHDESIARRCDRVLTMEDGRLSAREAKADPRPPGPAARMV